MVEVDQRPFQTPEYRLGSRKVTEGVLSSPKPDELLQRCRELITNFPPMSGNFTFKRSWSVEDSLEQHRDFGLLHKIQLGIANDHIRARTLQVELARLVALDVSSDSRSGADRAVCAGVAAKNLHLARKMLEIQVLKAKAKEKQMVDEIGKTKVEMSEFREAIDDVIHGGGGPALVDGKPVSSAKDDAGPGKIFYCSDCCVGGHGQRFCNYFLKRPNWRVFPHQKWFEDKDGKVSYCPLGTRSIDFTDETYFSRIAMHLKGRIWLEDKRKLYEFVPDLMPPTYIIVDGKWVSEAPPPEAPDASPMPWFVKQTDRNWGTSVMCCSRPEDCLSLTKPDASYVVQKHIPNPLLYYNGEKCHIKFYNLIVGMPDGVTWKLYTHKNGYLSISTKRWDPTDLSKEGQVTIIRSKRINDWPHWKRVYPYCRDGVRTVVQRAVEQGKLEGRNKIQFEIISADFIVSEDFTCYLLEFNSGPVLKDPEDSPEVHDAGMVSGALHIVEPWEGGDEDEWDFVFECKGVRPPELNGS